MRTGVGARLWPRIALLCLALVSLFPSTLGIKVGTSAKLSPPVPYSKARIARQAPSGNGKGPMPTCRFEVYTTAVWGFSFLRMNAAYEGQISMICNQENLTAWDVMDPLNIRAVEGRSMSQKEKQAVKLDKAPPGLAPNFVYFSTYRLEAPLLVEYDLRYYPWDLVFVAVTFEANFENSVFTLDYDEESRDFAEDFKTDPALALRDPNPDVISQTATYTDTYINADGDDSLPTFDRITIVLVFTRNDWTNFIVTMLPAYLAFVLSAGAVALHMGPTADNRVPIISASTFVVVLNINSINTYLGYPTTMTIGHIIAMVTLLLIGVIFVESIVEKWAWRSRERAEPGLTFKVLSTHKPWWQRTKPPRIPVPVPEENSAPVISLGSTLDKAIAPAFDSEEDKDSSQKSGLSSTERSIESGTLNNDQPNDDPAGKSKQAKFRRDKLEWLAWGTLIFVVTAYVAINIGLLVGYRPPHAYNGYDLVFVQHAWYDRR